MSYAWSEMPFPRPPRSAQESAQTEPAPSPAAEPGDRHGLPDQEIETNELAIASIFLSVVWVFGIGSVLGVILAVRSLRQIRESDGSQGGRSLAMTGLIAGLAGISSVFFMLYFAIRAAAAAPY